MRNRYTLEPDFDAPSKLLIYDMINGKNVFAIIYGHAAMANLVVQFMNRQNEENPLFKE